MSDIKREMMMERVDSRFPTTRLRDGSLQTIINGQHIYLSRVDAIGLRNSIDAALDGPGPKVVCEVVR